MIEAKTWVCCNDYVSTKEDKEVRLNLRIEESLRDGFYVAARLQGAVPASFLRQLIAGAVYEAKQKHPEAFAEVSGQAKKEPTKFTSADQKKAIRRERLDEALDNANQKGGGKVSEADRQRIHEVMDDIEDEDQEE